MPKYSIPQLRVRTEYSFKEAYGPVAEVAVALVQQGQLTGGIVDTAGTWGHVAWEKACGDAGVDAMFGVELEMHWPKAEEHHLDRKPRCWALAEDLAAFYRLSSADPHSPAELWENRAGSVIFAGAALDDPACFDYVDVNPRSRRAAQRSMRLAKRTKKPIVITSDNDFPSSEYRERFLAWNDSNKLTPQHLLTDAEFEKHFSFLRGGRASLRIAAALGADHFRGRGPSCLGGIGAAKSLGPRAHCAVDRGVRVATDP